jgi:hypothetical protein
VSRQATFDENEAAIALKERQHYKAAGNFWWCDQFFNPLAGVPIRWESVEELKTFYFEKAGCLYPGEIDVAVAAPDDLASTKGEMRRFSPLETPAALIMRIAEAIESNASEDEMRLWQNTCLSVSYHFHAMEGDEAMYFAAVQKRENFAVDFGTQAFTARQWVYFINTFKEKFSIHGKKVNLQELAASLKSKIKGPDNNAFKDDDDGISFEYVKKCVAVYDDMLSHPKVAALIEEAERNFGMGSPFNSVTKLYHMALKAKGKTTLLWAINGIIDMVNSKQMDARELSVRTIQGSGKGGKGIIDMMAMKLDMKVHLLETLQKLRIRDPVKTKITEIFASHESYRNAMGYPDDPSDITFQGGWWHSEVGIVQLQPGFWQRCAVDQFAVLGTRFGFLHWPTA